MGLQGKRLYGPRLSPPTRGDRAAPLRVRPASVQLTYRQERVVAPLAMSRQAWSFGEVLGVFREGQG